MIKTLFNKMVLSFAAIFAATLFAPITLAQSESIQPEKPDLTIVQGSLYIVPDEDIQLQEDIKFYFKVKNVGQEDFESGSLTFKVVDANTQHVYSITRAHTDIDLQIGEEREFNFTFPGFNKAEQKTVYIQVESSVANENISNNKSENITIDVQEEEPPVSTIDLAAQEVTFEPSDPVVNEEVKFNLKLKNLSTENYNDDLTLKLVNSSNNAVLKTITQPLSLNANETKTIFVNHTFEETGVKNLYLEIDPGVENENLTNNKSSVFSLTVEEEEEPEDEEVTIFVRLRGGQNVPPVVTSARGSATLKLNLETRELSGNISFNDLSSRSTGANIHTGNYGVNGPVLIPLEGGNGVRSGTYKVPEDTVFTQEQVEVLKDLGLYISIRSESYPQGELRGQIIYTTTPPVSMRDITILDYSYTPTNPNIDEDVEFKVEVSNVGNAWFNGNLELKLKDADSGEVLAAKTEQIRLIVSEVKNLTLNYAFDEEGEQNVYLEVSTNILNENTANNKTAAFKVNVQEADEDIITLNVPLIGGEEVPPVQTPAVGTGTLELNLDTRELSGTVVFSNLTSNSTGAHIHRGALGIEGAVLIPLEGGNGVRSGTYEVPEDTVLTQNQLDLLKDNRLYLNIHSVNYPDGEIRGQIEYTPEPVSNIDLVAQNVTFSPTNPEVGENVKFELKVKNVGTENFNDEIELKLVDSASGEVLATKTTETVSLMPNEVKSVYIDYAFDKEEERHLYLEINSGIEGENISNNRSSVFEVDFGDEIEPPMDLPNIIIRIIHDIENARTSIWIIIQHIF